MSWTWCIVIVVAIICGTLCFISWCDSKKGGK